MPSPLNRLRVVLATGALVLSLGGTAFAATPASVPVTAGSPDPIDIQAPDCLSSCTKTLGPGQRLVVAARYAFSSATVSGTASGFGARFIVKRSPDGTSYTKLADTPFTTSFGPVTFAMPGYYRAIATNDSTWLTTTVTLSLTTR
jgi:hypothetical protein